jgi:transposase
LRDGENGISLCHHVYPGNVADADELPEALSRLGVLWDGNQIARDTVTQVLDKGSAALGGGPMYHWSDSKIRIHAFYCMLGISLLQYLHRESRNVWPGLSVEQFLAELGQIQQCVLLYPPLGDKGPHRVATVLSKQSLAQQALAESLGLEQLCSTPRG